MMFRMNRMNDPVRLGPQLPLSWMSIPTLAFVGISYENPLFPEKKWCSTTNEEHTENHWICSLLLKTHQISSRRNVNNFKRTNNDVTSIWNGFMLQLVQQEYHLLPLLTGRWSWGNTTHRYCFMTPLFLLWIRNMDE